MTRGMGDRPTRRSLIYYVAPAVILFVVEPLCAGLGLRWFWAPAISVVLLALALVLDAGLRRANQ